MNHDLPYEMLFDLARQGPPNTGWLAFSAAALVIALALRWRARRRGQATAGPTFFALAFGVVLGVTCFSVWDHDRLQAALREGRTQVAEGLLQSYSVQHRAHYNTQSKRYDRSVAESFHVGEVAFGFVRDASAAGYTNAGREPLAFTPGDRLRVHYVEDTPGDFASRRIVRLERVRSPVASAIGFAGMAAPPAQVR